MKCREKIRGGVIMKTTIELKEAVSFLGANRKLIKLEDEVVLITDSFVIIQDDIKDSKTYIPLCNIQGVSFYK